MGGGHSDLVAFQLCHVILQNVVAAPAQAIPKPPPGAARLPFSGTRVPRSVAPQADTGEIVSAAFACGVSEAWEYAMELEKGLTHNSTRTLLVKASVLI
eukprot:COSAG02_NODE_382_length_23409_cov_45.812999_3_plen_99_part_00